MITLTRAASLAPTTFDAEANTIEAVISTGADVQRGGFVERLPIGNADLRNIAGAPVLDAHNQGSARAVLGVIQKAWKAAGEIRALIKLSSRDDVAGLVRDIADGILRNLSIGYRVKSWADSTDSKGNRVRTAVAWSIHEASFVPIGADAGAVTRSKPMKKKPAGANPAPVEDVEDSTPDNENNVAQTRAAIRDIIKRAGGTSDQADELIDQDATEEQARAAAYEIMTARTSPKIGVRIINPGPSPEETMHHRAAGFAARYLGVATKDDRAREFANLTVEDHARDWLESNGVRTRGMNREALLTAAFQTRAGQHTTSDFPIMMDIGLGVAVKAAYEAASSPLVSLCRKATANDFRTQSNIQLGELPKLMKVSESGEIKNVARGEAKESWALETFGLIFSASRKLILNDSFNQLGDFAAQAGQAAANTVADLIVTALTQSSGAGPTMGDTVRLFHASHGNLDSTGQAIGVDSVSAARVAMLTQTGVDGQTLINVRPDTLAVAPSQLTAAEQFVATYQPVTFDTTNPFSQKLSVVCEPRLEAVSPWDYYLADSRLPALVLGGLAGNEGVQIASRDGFEILGREWRATLDAGVGPNDWRGWYRFGGHDDSNSAGA